MKLFKSVASAAIVGACLISAGASATSNREPVTVQVRHADLNLKSDSGQTAFRHRLRAAINTACVSRVAGLAGRGDVQQCRREMTEDARIQTAAILQRNGVQLASIVVPR